MQHPENDGEDNNALMLKCHNRLISSYSRWASGLTCPQTNGGGTNSSSNATHHEERRERILPANFAEILATVNSHVAKNRKAFIDAERRRGDLTYLYVAQIDNGDKDTPANIQQQRTYSYVAEFDSYDESSSNNNPNNLSLSISNNLPKLASNTNNSPTSGVSQNYMNGSNVV
jgi:hypothetical protein